jgi:hypothetical protein
MNRTLVTKSHLTCLKGEIEKVELFRIRFVRQMNRMVVIIIPYWPDLRFVYGLERFTCNKTTIGERNLADRTSFMILSSNGCRKSNLGLELRDLDEWHLNDNNLLVTCSLTWFEVDASAQKWLGNMNITVFVNIPLLFDCQWSCNLQGFQWTGE